jgi:putative ABC transport system permease protein
MGGLWPIVLRSLRARPLRGALTAVAVALGVAAILGMQLSLRALDNQADAAQAARAGRSQLDVRAVRGAGITRIELDALRQLPGVAEVQPYRGKPVVALAGETADPPTVNVVAVERGEVAMRPVQLVAGRLPQEDAVFEVAIDDGLRSMLSLPGMPPVGVGDDIRLTTETGPDRFRVVGVAVGTSGGLAFTRSAVYLSPAATQRVFSLGLRTPLAALRLAAAADSQAVAVSIRDALGDAAVITDPRAGAAAPLGGERPLLVLLAALGVIIGAGVTANSVAVGAAERRREMGLLRAAGASGRQVFRLIVAEAAVLGLAGAVAGIGLGLGLAAVLVDHYAVSGPRPGLVLDPLRTLGAVVAGAGAALVGSVIPAIAAARLSPLAAMRAHPTNERERPSRLLIAAAPLLLLVAGVTALSERPEVVVVSIAALFAAVAAALPLLAPALLRALGRLLAPLASQAPVAAANLARRPGRTALTTASLAVSIASATAISALTAGALSAGDRWVDRLFAGDVVIAAAATQRDGIADALHADLVAAGHESVGLTPVRYLASSVENTPLGIAAIDPAAHARAGALDVVRGDRTTALAELGTEPTVLLPAQLADGLGWRVGQVLTVVAAGGEPVRVRVAGVVAHSLPAGDNREAVLVSRDQATKLFGAAAGGFDLLEASTGDAGPAVARAASRYGMRATAVSTIREAAGAALHNSIGLLLALAWVAVTVAMLAVVNTLLVNVRQGTRELALLRAVGLSRRQAIRLVLAEAGLLAAVGSLVGVGAGCLAAIPLLRASAAPGFQPGFAFPFAAIAGTVLAMVVGAVLAAFLPARRSARASIVAAIRDQ